MSSVKVEQKTTKRQSFVFKLIVINIQKIMTYLYQNSNYLKQKYEV